MPFLKFDKNCKYIKTILEMFKSSNVDFKTLKVFNIYLDYSLRG